MKKKYLIAKMSQKCQNIYWLLKKTGFTLLKPVDSKKTVFFSHWRCYNTADKIRYGKIKKQRAKEITRPPFLFSTENKGTDS